MIASALVVLTSLGARAGPFDSVPTLSFVNRIGINIHADGYNTAYDNFDRSNLNPQPDPIGLQNIEAALRVLKIVHVRDGLDNQYFLPLYPKLYSDLGVKFDFVITSAHIAGDTTGDQSFAFKIASSASSRRSPATPITATRISTSAPAGFRAIPDRPSRPTIRMIPR